MKDLRFVRQSCIDHLTKKKIISAKIDTDLLLCHVLKTDRLSLYTDLDRPLTKDELDLMRALLTRRANLEPLAYLIGTVPFHECTIEVNPHVLIPRPETEELIEKLIKTFENESIERKVLWDLCCGSGCIGIALKKKFPSLTVLQSDISERACQTTKANAKKNGVETVIKQGDFEKPFADQKVDFIVCNPPYVTKEEYELCEPNVKNFEPKGALVADNNGLYFYQRLAAVFLKNPIETLYFEMGVNQQNSIQPLFSQWKSIEFWDDLSNRPRFGKAKSAL